jgi:CheY-like chemotaxis protein
MSKEEQTRIIHRFEQADSSTTRKYGGTGLGLAITSSLVNLMKGDLDIESVVGEGTTIRLDLPLDRAVVEKPKSEEQYDAPPWIPHIKILIAEDNEINQAILSSMLSPTGATLVMVDNGKKAVDVCSTASFDLILMDIQMPVMDGVEAFSRIKRKHPDLPIVALTANVMTQDVESYKELGFWAHIGKPIDIKVLYRLLHTI